MPLETAQVGFNGLLQWSATVGSDPSAVAGLAAIDTARDVNVTISVDKTEVTDRRSQFKRYCPSMIEVEVTATLTYTADSNDFIQKCIDRDVMTIAVLHNSASEGIYFTGQCFTSDLAQPLTDGMTISVSFCPVRQTGTGAGGAPVWG
jgi:hypothetical protein